ncbi:YgaP family membrane protein [Natranaeroarchaeum sulfidigenes]|uniref:DUF2892 family n=1 Tax=Natranaeroarchaeum sulfidigenes TaxID=2784880 RepID=A0A897MVM1_9EURY|nr:DUF2892 domain-containing protein [Natranaeroarchaeum sulfidigenes]QSG04321.1 DUF2892 family [Natranaeroarchaeum sulfidigenes]
MFEKNVGGTDRTLRFVGGAALLLVGVVTLGRRSKRNGLGALVVGAGLLASALTQRCTVNKLLGIDTCPAE